MQLELQRVHGVEDFVRENERLRMHIKSLEDKYDVPPDQRYGSIQVTSTPQHDACYQTPGGECLRPSLYGLTSGIALSSSPIRARS
jgi:hypothetical protein